MRRWTRIPSPACGRGCRAERATGEGPHPTPLRGATFSRKREKEAHAFFTALLILFSSPAIADEAFVTAQGADALSIVDLAKMETVATLPIGGKPAGIAVSRDGARAFVTSPEGKFLTIIDAATRRIEKRIPVEGGPLGVAASPDGKRVYVADLYGRRLVEIDLASGAQRSVGVGAMASGVAVAPDGKTIVVADRDDNALSVIDAATFSRVATIAVGKHPFGVTIDASGARAYSANVESDDVSVVDLAARKLVATLKCGSRPYTVALAKGRIFVANQHGDSVSVFDAESLAPLQTLKVGEYPEGLAASADGARIYVANWFSNELWALDAQTLKVVGKAETGDGPRAFGAVVRDAEESASRLDVFRPHAKPDEPRRQSTQQRHSVEEAQHKRRLQGLLSREHAAHHAILDEQLNRLRHASRKFPAPLHRGHIRIAQRIVAQLRGKEIGGGDGVLDREIHADPADRRHGVGGVADAQQSRPAPLLEAIDLDGEQAHVAPILERIDAIGEEWRQTRDRVSKGVDALLAQFLGAAFRNDAAALPIGAAVDHRQHAPRREAAEAFVRVALLSRQLEPKNIHRRAEVLDGELGVVAHARTAPVGGDDEPCIDNQLSVRPCRRHAADALAVEQEFFSRRLHQQTEIGQRSRMFGDKVEKIPLRHEGDEIAFAG